MKSYKYSNKYRKNLWQSQNYFKSSNLIDNLLDKTSICKNDTVIEIGPGKGVITWQLIKKCKEVIGIEYDFVQYKQLKEKLMNIKNVNIINKDFLKYKLPSKTPYKVFSNIPFNITAQIINKLIFESYPADDIYLVMQKEAAYKYAGSPYNQERMRSLLIKPFFETTIIHRFKRIDFYPVPNVNVVLFNIKKRKDSLVSNRDKYNDFIAYSFSNHGRNLKDRLAKIFTDKQFNRLSESAGFNKTCGLLELNYKQWIVLYKYYTQYITKQKKRCVEGAYEKLIRQQKKLSKIHRNRRKNK